MSRNPVQSHAVHWVASCRRWQRNPLLHHGVSDPILFCRMHRVWGQTLLLVGRSLEALLKVVQSICHKAQHVVSPWLWICAPSAQLGLESYFTCETTYSESCSFSWSSLPMAPLSTPDLPQETFQRSIMCRERITQSIQVGPKLHMFHLRREEENQRQIFSLVPPPTKLFCSR